MSMSEVKRIADQLRRSLSGTAWHGPSLFELLGDVTSEEANTHPVPGGHSIAELVLHVAAWMDVARRRLDTDVPTLQGEADWPLPGEWAAAVSTLRQAGTQLAERVDRLSDEDLEKKVRADAAEYSQYFLLHGVTQHNLYHAGQIAMLRKALRTR